MTLTHVKQVLFTCIHDSKKHVFSSERYMWSKCVSYMSWKENNYLQFFKNGKVIVFLYILKLYHLRFLTSNYILTSASLIYLCKTHTSEVLYHLVVLPLDILILEKKITKFIWECVIFELILNHLIKQPLSEFSVVDHFVHCYIIFANSQLWFIVLSQKFPN